MGEKFDAVFSDLIVVLESHATLQLKRIQTGFDGKHLTCLKRIVPVRIKVRRFVRKEPKAVTQVMIENAHRGLIQYPLYFME